MKLENQVCTLQQAKRLRELGITQKSLFYHHPLFGKPVFGETRLNFTKPHRKLVCNDKENSFSAFTVAELGAMLPTGYDTMRCTEIDWVTEEWHGFDDLGKDFPDENGYKTEAECRAAMVIRLLENGAINAEEVNQRLAA